ncbi:unnamed protein product [Darwinula stevensoni]|uniref:Uncharacterized protein n=1 Tax=Darwinula stevensoni TaxID=69355 RepID=A0A7R9A603_9CRUS|nr:unnamed protein product [Darwinula stevensoni]CAG0893099.1 unnamed protein product [Darwinula stevensoni]
MSSLSLFLARFVQFPVSAYHYPAVDLYLHLHTSPMAITP